MKHRNQILSISLAVLGALFVAAAFWARQIGIDNNDRWGLGRYLLLGVGFLIWVGSAWLQTRSLRQRWMSSFEDKMHHHRLVRAAQQGWSRMQMAWRQSKWFRLLAVWRARLACLPGIRSLAVSLERQAVFWAGVGLVVTLMGYGWLATAGTMRQLVPTSNFYDMQARAFLHGQLSLLEKPSAQLLALENPYDVRARQNISYIWDASLYKGQYYVYWGSVPALLAAAFRSVSGNGMGDETLAFLFLCLLAGVQTLWLLDLRKEFFPQSDPGWLLGFVLVAGLANPIPFMIARLMVYEASILAGQFFLLSGVLLAKQGCRSERISTAKWLLAGLMLGLALTSRINLLPVMIWITGMLVGRALQVTRGKWQPIVKPALAAGLAGGVILAGLMFYNAARFDSPFEFGSRFQLTVTDINHGYATVVSPAYIIPNLYAYLLRPVETVGHFPFIYISWVTDKSWPFFIRIPAGYFYTDPVAGVLLVTPFIWLLAVTIWGMASDLRWVCRTDGVKFLANRIFNEQWSIWLLSGMGLLAFIFILIFYYPAMRYLADATPTLILVSVIGAWQWIGSGRMHGFKKWVLVLLILITLMTGMLLGINGQHDFMEQANPGLYYYLVNGVKMPW